MELNNLENKYFTQVNEIRCVPGEPVSLKELTAMTEQLEKNRLESIKRMFMGIPVVVDESLEGFNYNIHVSPKIYQEMQEKAGK